MGVGKTTVGRALAEHIGYRFIDNDAGIEAEHDATGAELAERLGVDGLHRIEAQQLESALESFGSEPVVIAAAASVVDDPDCQTLLARHTVVWLDAPPDYLAGRLGHARSPATALAPIPGESLGRWLSSDRRLRSAERGFASPWPSRAAGAIDRRGDRSRAHLTAPPRAEVPAGKVEAVSGGAHERSALHPVPSTSHSRTRGGRARRAVL